jgi:ATP-dependent exoDNAse (exonuclease V) alpha subunit
MAQFSMRVLVVKRSKAQSVMASAAYRAGEKLWDERQGVWHDFRHKSTGVIHKEMLFPADSPAWVQGISREKFWLAVDASESRRDAQTARDVRLMIPREIPESDRVKLVRDFVLQHFVSKGMVADVCWHNTIASDGKEQPHAHILLTMRPLSAEGFGLKSRHEYIADPSGRTHKDGRPVMIESNPDSWNSAAYYEKCREGWENTANAALERAGSAERIDRRSLLARGLARIPQPYMGLALKLAELKGHMRQRWGQFEAAKLYRSVEQRAGAVFRLAEDDPAAALLARAKARASAPRRDETPAQKVNRFMAWFDRQIERLAVTPEPADPALAQSRPERGTPQPPPPPAEMER